MRAIILLGLTLGCATNGRLDRLHAVVADHERQLHAQEVRTEAICLRFERFQIDRFGEVIEPCVQKDGTAHLTTIYGRGR